MRVAHSRNAAGSSLIVALREWATRIAVRYMGADRGAEFGARNAVEDEMLVRLTPSHVLAQADTAA